MILRRHFVGVYIHTSLHACVHAPCLYIHSTDYSPLRLLEEEEQQLLLLRQRVFVTMSSAENSRSTGYRMRLMTLMKLILKTSRYSASLLSISRERFYFFFSSCVPAYLSVFIQSTNGERKRNSSLTLPFLLLPDEKNPRERQLRSVP